MKLSYQAQRSLFGTLPSRMIQTVTLGILSLVVVGCRHGTNKLDMKLNDAVKRQALIDERIVDWGSPVGVNTLSDNRIVYTWKFPWTGSYVNYGVPGGQAYSVQHWCTVIVTTSPENIVQGYTYRDC